MSDVVYLHPTVWTRGLFANTKHPLCPECRAEILPGTPVVIDEDEASGLTWVRHEACAKPDGGQDELPPTG